MFVLIANFLQSCLLLQDFKNHKLKVGVSYYDICFLIGNELSTVQLLGKQQLGQSPQIGKVDSSNIYHS